MTVTIQTASDEVTPLLDGSEVSANESSSVVAAVAGPSNQKINANDILEQTKKTPLPWAQFSIILFLELAEPLTSQVIYPVSFTLDVSYPALNTPAPLVCT